ncbi:hypothetical protein NQ315_004610 [Exocentrus adspersus]|uniref:Toll-like receptor 3 n=1 Tax=Exocentrus adspersus TaxID=1586481 RepID=A0AAV8VN82_9CUCU|nr:hypothetical protein NQ315_004610 [Exocentrus adspersus]
MQKEIWAIIVLVAALNVHFVTSLFVSPFDLMKCSYGERGSLTATCINATAGYFKSTPYRFDQLDETLRCVNCSLKTIDSGTFDISGNQIKNLDLTRSQIELLKQKAFVGLIFLENLYLNDNNIRAIYAGTFSGVKKIKYINLSDNQIDILSEDGFLELQNLEKLDLEHNNIKTITSKAFNGLAKLKELNLRNNQLSEIKDGLSNLTSLEILNLENNLIYSLKGPEFFNLTSLLELNIAHNRLQNVVIEFKPQSLLRNLFLQNNFVSTIPANFLKGLHNLENLDLSYNVISEINQKTLQDLYNLRNLNISYNKLTKFQTGIFSGLPQLELLNCSHNTIQTLEVTGVFNLHSLHALDLSYNQLEDVDYVGLISRLPRLSYLKLENNVLPCDLEAEMDEYFAEDNFKYVLYDNSVGSLKCINKPVKPTRALVPDKLLGEEKPTTKGASGAEISTLLWICAVTALADSVPIRTPFGFSNPMVCSYGERGSLTVNCVNATSSFFKLAPYRFDHLDETLKCINCTLNSLDAGTFDLSGNQIKALDIRNSSISKIWPRAFIGLIFMEKLLLSNNPILNIYPGAFIGVRKVKYIEMENAVSSLDPLVFEELHQLEVLNLKQNKLSVLDNGVFEGLKNLKVLDLSFNRLKSLSGCFAPLISLKTLNLQDNQITKITGNEFTTLLSLIHLDLASNALTNFTINIDPNNNLRVLNLARNRLTSDGVKLGTFKDLNRLENLDLSKNLFNKIPPKFFQGLFKLRILNLYANELKVFSTGSFSGLPHLLNLNLSSNYLTSAKISGHLLLHSLHTLDLSNNDIKEFDYIAFVACMPRITRVNLLNNNLPCETAAEIETLFNEDNIRFYMSNKGTVENCDTPPKSPKEIIQKFVNEKNKDRSSHATEITLVILIAFVVVLIALLFYVQFFILYRIQPRNFNIHITHTPNSSS